MKDIRKITKYADEAVLGAAKALIDNGYTDEVIPGPCNFHQLKSGEVKFTFSLKFREKVGADPETVRTRLDQPVP